MRRAEKLVSQKSNFLALTDQWDSWSHRLWPTSLGPGRLLARVVKLKDPRSHSSIKAKGKVVSFVTSILEFYDFCTKFIHQLQLSGLVFEYKQSFGFKRLKCRNV